MLWQPVLFFNGNGLMWNILYSYLLSKGIIWYINGEGIEPHVFVRIKKDPNNSREHYLTYSKF